MGERWRQIERIYHAAREMDGTARAEFLAKACAGDPTLREEVESLLVQADQDGSFMESPAIEMAAGALANEETGRQDEGTGLAGTTVSHYRILRKLGGGGMGVVYEAEDAKLGRWVALKFLPPDVLAEPKALERFQREARAAAALNHPNICTIYEIGEYEGKPFIAMELLEGQTLREKIVGEGSALSAGRSPIDSIGVQKSDPREPEGLPYEEALPIARQIAEALEYAHERGIIHRDLKPANVKITPEGTVKVLDFGLAKVFNPQDSTGSDPANPPTMTTLATQPGMLLGTASYMSPEQAKGQRVDKRCDIWAFGCVLYETVSGRKAFEGETISDVLASVIKSDPDWNALPNTTPAGIQRLIRRCLVKDPKQRLRDIGDARIAIEEILSGSTSLTSPLPQGEGGPEERDRTRVPPLRRALPWALAGLLAVGLMTVVALWKFSAPAPQQFPVSFYIPPPPNTTFRYFGFGAGPVVVSPDGRQLAFSATDQNGVTKLWVRPLASSDAHAIPGTEDAGMSFWSPDGGSLGFFADQRLKTVNLRNGNVQVLADDSCPDGGAWSPNGTILFAPRCNEPFNEVSSSGGSPSPVGKFRSGENGYWSPAFLPDGRHFLYVSSSSSSTSASIWMASLGSSKQKLILKGASSPRFASGYLLFIQDNRVFAQPFDPAAGELSGEAIALAEAQSYSVSASSVLAFQGGSRLGRPEWFDRSGKSLGSVGPVAMYLAANISPDATRVLADIYDTESNWSDLWSYPAAGGVGTRLTFGPGLKTFAVWPPDGKYVAYSCRPGGKAGICRKAADGSGREETLFAFGAGVSRVNVVDWSPDGRYLSFDEFVPRGAGVENWILPLFGGRKLFQAASVGAAQYGGTFSRDGRWLAYFSYETGRPEVYVVPFPGPGGKFQISQNGGWLDRWDKKGRLYFLTMGNRLMEADLATSGASLQVKSLHPIFQLSLPGYPDPLFDVTADGSRFLVITSADPNASRSIGVLLDWESKLKGKE